VPDKHKYSSAKKVFLNNNITILYGLKIKGSHDYTKVIQIQSIVVYLKLKGLGKKFEALKILSLTRSIVYQNIKETLK